jgi:hypothetical protein
MICPLRKLEIMEKPIIVIATRPMASTGKFHVVYIMGHVTPSKASGRPKLIKAM